MMRIAGLISLVLVGIAMATTPATAQGSELISKLVGDLGVTEAQAKGGTKALIEAAKTGLTGDEFSQLTSLPQLAGLLGDDAGAAASAATVAAGAADLGSMAESAMRSMGGDEGASDSLSTMAGAAADQMGGLDLGRLSELQGLTSAFGNLGLDAGMVQKFVPIVLDGLGGSGGKNLLMKGLGLL